MNKRAVERQKKHVQIKRAEITSVRCLVEAKVLQNNKLMVNVNQQIEHTKQSRGNYTKVHTTKRQRQCHNEW